MGDIFRRWITEKGTFRILAASATNTVGEAVSVMGCNSEVGALYGEFLMGAALYQLAFAPADRVQCAIEHQGATGPIVADIRPGVVVRGRVEVPQATGTLLGGASRLRVTRRPHRGGEPYESLIAIPRRKIADAFQVYALQSDQVVSFMALHSIYEEEKLTLAGGFILQALPGATHEDLSEVTQCLEHSRFEDQLILTKDPFQAIHGMFHGLDLQQLGEDPLEYRCSCSQGSVLVALRTLNKEELEEALEGQAPSISCEFCKTEYHCSSEELRQLIREKKDLEKAD